MEWRSPSSLVVCGGKLLECLDRWDEVISTTDERGIPGQSITDAILSSRHPSEHAGQAMLITTEANTHRSMRASLSEQGIAAEDVLFSPMLFDHGARPANASRTRRMKRTPPALEKIAGLVSYLTSSPTISSKHQRSSSAVRATCRDYWLIFSCCAMKASAVSATSRHPWSMTRECPRLGISRISVTAGFFSCCL